MTFAEYAEAIETKPWPSVNGDAVVKEAIANLQSGRRGMDYTREQRLDDLASLLWYAATYARLERFAFTSVADRSIARLSRLPPNDAFGP